MDFEINDYRTFIKAGKAIFTVQNNETGNRLTYKVTKCKSDDSLYFVSVMRGPSNVTDYTYIGIIRNGVFTLTAKSRVNKDSMSFQAFQWLNTQFNKNSKLPDHVHVYHEGRCGRCGKRLTVPESILCGFGPECVKIMA